MKPRSGVEFVRVGEVRLKTCVRRLDETLNGNAFVILASPSSLATIHPTNQDDDALSSDPIEDFASVAERK